MKIPRPPALPKELSQPPRDDRPPPSRGVSTWLDRLASVQLKHPFKVLLLPIAIAVLGLFLARNLEIYTGFESLLPEERRSVQELRRVASKTSGVSTLFIVLYAPDDGTPPPTKELREVADALVPELEAVGPPWVGNAESGVHEALDYLQPRAGLYGDLSKLVSLRDDIRESYEAEVKKQAGIDLGLDDDKPKGAPELDVDKIKADFGLDTVDEDRFPDGYYQDAQGRTVVVAVRSKVLGSDFDDGTAAISKIREAVERVNPKRFDPRIEYGFSGDLQTSISEYTAVNTDLTEVGILGAFLISSVVLLYYLRIRTLFAMLVTILIGISWTFGLTELMVGHLNVATGFLFTIIAGNGINTGIIYMARYLESRRDGGSLETAIRTSHRETWLPTLTAASAASAAFGSLVITEFRGFRDFGMIGGVGMVTCWLATFLALPPVLILLERFFPIKASEGKGWFARFRLVTQQGIQYGRPFASLVGRFPRAVLVLGSILAVVGIAAMGFYVQSDPMEYDLRNLRTDASQRAEEIRLGKLAEEITGHVTSDGMAILVESPEQVGALKQKLHAIRDAAPEHEKPFHDVHALQDWVPGDQVQKIPVLLDIKDYILKAHKEGLIEDADFERLEPFIPPDSIEPFEMADLPPGIARLFTEVDGTRGRIVYISPTDAALVDDAHYLFRWADSYRETQLDDGSVVLGSGRAVIYADMWTAVLSDIPPAVIASFLATMIVVCVAFRAGRPALAVIASLLVGVAWMAGCLVLLNVKLNFLNFIALPITFGIGVDYAVNIVQRYAREGVGSALLALRETGGAVVLCSLTTMLGYFALVGSMNFAVRSLGVAAVIGEFTCLLAAVLVLPACLVFLDRRRPKGSESFLSMAPKKDD